MTAVPPIRACVVETPAGFEPDSAHVRGRLVEFLLHRIQLEPTLVAPQARNAWQARTSRLRSTTPAAPRAAPPAKRTAPQSSPALPRRAVLTEAARKTSTWKADP